MSQKRQNGTQDPSTAKRLRTTALSEELIESDAGIINHMTLKNFMCHDYLDFRFGPNINFIIGRNGSGKSAVLTATIIGLGGSANCTNRGSSIKNFIKNGKQACEITIELCNKGADAYKPDELGNNISIVRKFSLNGASDYKILDERKKVISRKKDYLNRILDHFNIQIDNPLCILNQDASRKFLQSEKPESLYRFFLKATQLLQMKSDYDEALTKNRNANLILERKKMAIPGLEKDEKACKKKLDALESVEKYREKLLKLNAEFAWSQVAELETELNEKNSKLGQLLQRKNELTKIIEQSEQNVNSCIEDSSEANAEYECATKKLKDLTTLRGELKSRADLKRKQQKNALLEAEKINLNIKQAINEKSCFIERIRELNKMENGVSENDKALRLKKIKDLEERVAELKEKCKNVEGECQQEKTQGVSIRDDINKLKQKNANLENRIQANKAKLRNFESSRSDCMKMFGNWVPDALTQIDAAYKQGRFKRKPLGPIGAFVKLKDAKWNLAIENCIKSYLHAFCCDNHSDERMLESILSKVVRQQKGGRMPTIITSQFADVVHNVQEHCAQSSQYPKLLDMLKIDSPVMTNCLIDQAGIERVILIENTSEARRTMQSVPPRNCSMAYTKNGDQIYPSPKFRVYSSQRDKATFLQANVEDIIGTLQNECAIMENEQRETQHQISALGNNYELNARNVKRLESNLMRLRQNIRDDSAQIVQLKSIEDPEPPQVASLEEELEEIENKIDSFKEKIKGCHNDAKKCKEEGLQDLKQIEEIDEKRKEILNVIDPLKESLGKLKEAIRNAKQEHSYSENSLKKVDASIKELTKIISKNKEDIEKYTQGCIVKAGPRPPKVGTVTDIQKQIKHISGVLEQRNIIGDETELLQKYAVIKKKLTEFKKDITSLDCFIMKLKEVLKSRLTYYKFLQSHTAFKIKQFFSTNLNQRNFTGKLDFDHDNEKLFISIQPKSTSPSQAKKDVRGLSGGERSFSTVAFILALWEMIDSPFRMMDEFDVFMDMVNRHISLQMIVDAASAKRTNQFIFLTPLEDKKIKANSVVKMFRMRDPERNQPTRPLPSASHSEENEGETMGNS